MSREVNAANKAETVFYLTQTPNPVGVYLIRFFRTIGVLPFSGCYRDSSSDYYTCPSLVTKQLVHGVITLTIMSRISETTIEDCRIHGIKTYDFNI